MRNATVRISKVLIFIVAFLFVAIIIRLSYISLSSTIDGVNLSEFAENRNTKTEVIAAKRGNIYDNAGNLLASTVNTYKIIAYLDESRTTDEDNPQHVVDKEYTAEVLNEYLGIDYDEALALLNKDAYQTEFGTKGKNISETVKNQIDALDLPGIDFVATQTRTYSMGEFASYIIGYAKTVYEDDTDEEGTITGELGIEGYYNDTLSGTDGYTTYQTDAYGYTLPSAEVITEDAVDGADIYLTLDSQIQLFAEELVDNLTSEYEMDWMIFTVMDANTGAILASSTYPNFDPNDLNTISSYMNPLVSYSYEPGSVMKIFSWASLIEEGEYDGDETFKSGSIKVADVTISDFNKTGWGTISFDTGFVYSSNVAASYIAERLGVSRLTDYYKELGFGSKTGIELANEVSGTIDITYASELATAAFGQGITVTPIQMLQALTALTNDGTVIRPYIVDKIVDNDGNTIYEGGREEVAKVYSKETMDYMKDLMYDAVYNGLTTYWQPSKTTMIGKTGTAQIASSSGGYLTGTYNYIRSFAGIFPYDDPKYIVYIVVKQINTSATAIGNALTKAVDDIAAYMGLVESDSEVEEKIIELNNYISADVTTTTQELENNKFRVVTLGTGKYVINQYPLKGTKAIQGSIVFLVTNNDEYMMENLTGWSLNEVTTYANLLGITLKTNGYGYVTSQSIEEGTSVNADMTLEVTLSTTTEQ